MNKFNLSLLLGLLALLSFVACTSCTNGTSEGETTEAPPLENIFKQKRNVVYARLSAEPDRINPLLSTSAYSRPLWEQIFLAPLDINPQTLELDPVLAVSRPLIEEITEGLNAGGLTYTFELRPEATWDDGTPITAHDMVFTFKTMFNPHVSAAAHRAFFESIQDIEVDAANNKKFTVVTNEKYILGEASIGTMNIFPAHIFDPEGLMANFELADLIANGAEMEDERLQQFADMFQSAPYSRDKDKVLGSGPYAFESWEAGQYLVLAKKTSWWGDGLVDKNPQLTALPDSMVFRIVSDQTAAINALKDEVLDVSFQLDSKKFSDLTANEFAKTHLNLHTPQALQFLYIAFNMEDPLLEDKRVRRAMAHLLDVDVIIEKLYLGYATRVTNAVHPSKPYYNKDLAPIPYDLEEAVTLLKEAGWEDSNGDGIVDKEVDGERLEMKLDYLLTPGSPFAQGLADLLKANAIQAGIEVNVVTMEFRTMMTEQIAPRKFQLFGLGAGADPLLDDFTQLWHTSSNTPGGGNRTQFGNAETDGLIERIRAETDSEVRNGLYKEFQEVLYEEQPMIFLFAPQERIAISKRFEAKPYVVRPGYDVKSFDYRFD